MNATLRQSHCFAACLVKHRYLGTGQVKVRVEPGYEIGRPPLIQLKAQGHGGTMHGEVSGKVVLAAQERLR